MTIIVSLKDIVIDPNKDIDLTGMSEEKAIELIQKSYGFLSSAINVKIIDGKAVINFPDEQKHKVDKALEINREAVSNAEKGKYKRAIQLFQQVLEVLPNHIEARRNLGMAHMEIGQYDEAKNYLIDVLRIEPKDTWSYLLLGNIYSKHEHDLKTAEKFYLKTYELNPKDSYMLNNYAALLLELEKFNEAENLFTEALSINPKYPNSYYGLALSYSSQGRIELALATLNDLFKNASGEDLRSVPVYQNARELYFELNVKIANKNLSMITSFIEDRKINLETLGNHPIKMIEDNNLENVTARTQMAWKHNRDYHEIKFKKIERLIIPHILAHEMEHISLEHEARKIGRNRIFMSTSENRKIAINSIGDHVYKLKSMGFSENSITDTTLKLVHGLTNQLFNIPLDMVIEKRLFQEFDVLRPSQFISLFNFAEQNLNVFTNADIKRLTPELIYRANITMNVAYALCIDSLYQGRTNYSLPYKNSNYYSNGEKLFQLWLDTENNYRHGDEYLLVDKFARVLKLQDWYSIDIDEAEEIVGEGATNPELLKQKEPATVMYLLSAMKRFEKMHKDDIYKVAGEIALLGRTGIDYTKSNKRYSLQSIPEEQFTGLQLLAMMYVGFQNIDPSLNVGLDFKDAYQTALKLYSKSEEE
ncbi:MAG: tetratricopeptide repeat protein [Ignavibacteriales bacterium]|nr:tetratricopeptide repeat protein [Ignavibacteriales bacterium]